MKVRLRYVYLVNANLLYAHTVCTDLLVFALIIFGWYEGG